MRTGVWIDPDFCLRVRPEIVPRLLELYPAGKVASDDSAIVNSQVDLNDSLGPLMNVDDVIASGNIFLANKFFYDMEERCDEEDCEKQEREFMRRVFESGFLEELLPHLSEWIGAPTQFIEERPESKYRIIHRDLFDHHSALYVYAQFCSLSGDCQAFRSMMTREHDVERVLEAISDLDDFDPDLFVIAHESRPEETLELARSYKWKSYLRDKAEEHDDHAEFRGLIKKLIS